jgi:hypothetical protein
MYPTAERFGATSLFLPTDYLFPAPSQEVCLGLLRTPLAHTTPASAVYLLSGPRNFVKAVRDRATKLVQKKNNGLNIFVKPGSSPSKLHLLVQVWRYTSA